MPTSSFSVHADLAAPPDIAFAYVADLTRHGEWSANLLQIEALSPGPIAVGSRYRSTAQVNQLHFAAQLQVTQYDPPTHFGFAGEDTTGQFEHRFTFQPRAGGTRLERHIQFTLTPSQWLIFLVLFYPVRLPAARKALRLLKARLEPAAP